MDTFKGKSVLATLRDVEKRRRKMLKLKGGHRRDEDENQKESKYGENIDDIDEEGKQAKDEKKIYFPKVDIQFVQIEAKKNEKKFVLFV